MGSNGLIIAKQGYSYDDPDIRNIMFDSRYKLLKQYKELTGSLVFSAGVTQGTLIMNHGLGYVPAYLPFVKYLDKYSGTSKHFILPNYNDGPLGSINIDSYVDNQNIVFKVETPDFYRLTFPFMFDYVDVYSNYDDFTLIFGNDNDSRDGAIRFYNVALNRNQSISQATLEFWNSEKGPSTLDAKLQCWGINEGDCGDIFFNLGRQKTNARTVQNVAAAANEYFGIDVTAQVREIIGRPDWNSGNHMGFYIFNNDSPVGAWRRDYHYKTYLKIILPGSYTMYFKAVIFLDKIL